MSVFQVLAPGVFVAGQIDAEDLIAARDQGIGHVINNRPDDEEWGQPSSTEMAVAARAAGLDYSYVPIRGMPDDHAVDIIEAALTEGQPVLLHCKSGMRSTVAWALASIRLGSDSQTVRAAATAAGYDLSRLPL